MNSDVQADKPSFFNTTFFLKTTFAKLLLLILVIGGWLSGSNMVKESMPDMSMANANITTVWAGGDSQTIEQEITNKLEKELKSLKGLKRIRSGSFSGYSVISVEFRSGVEPRDAIARVRTKVSEAEGKLPKEADKPSVTQVSVNDSPIYSIRLFGNSELPELTALAKNLKKELDRIPGVNKTKISGDREEIVMIRLIGPRIAALGLSPIAIRNAVQQANLDMPWGNFDGEDVNGATFRLTGRYRNVEQLQELPVHRTSSGRVVHLGEIAEVTITEAEERTRTFFSQHNDDFARAVEVSLIKRAGGDTIDIIQLAQKVLDEQKASTNWPESIDYAVVVDESENILRDLKNVFNNGWQAMLAVFVILFFSLTWREALVAGLAIPIAFAGGLIVIALMGYTLNQIVIIGMVIALGLLVDVFILMMEGMHDNMFVKGKNFGSSALATIKQYAIPALTGQLTTIFAMAPLLGIAGATGKFIKPMPMTAIACLVAAYIVALLLCIPLSRYVLPKPGTKVKKTKIDIVSERLSNRLAGLLSRRFTNSRRSSLVWIGVALLVFGGSLGVFLTLPTEMMPKGDGRNTGILIELEPDASMASAQYCADAVGKQLRQLDYLDSVTKYVGEKSPFSTPTPADQLQPTKSLSFVGFTAILVPNTERSKLGFEYMPELASEIHKVMDACPGGELLLTPSVGGASPGSPVQIEIIGDDMEALRDIADLIVSELKTIKGTENVRQNLGLPSLDLKATPKAEALNFYNITNDDLADQIRMMMNSDEIGKFVVGDIEEDIKIHMGYGWPSRGEEIGGPTNTFETYLLGVTTPEGKHIPVSSLVDIDITESPIAILHRDGKRAVTILSDNINRTAGEILADIKPKLDELQKDWPDGYRYVFSGEAEDSAEVFGSAGIMLNIALFLVFALLVMQFDSFLQPLIVMSAIPLALTGTFFGLTLFGVPFSFMAMVGVIALVGIVVNDSIVIIDTMNGYRKKNYSIADAASRGAADRLRPVITTSITTIVGMLPLTLSQKMWLPLGLTVISGLTAATFLSLLIVPCLYVVFTRNKKIEEESL
ncbi:efflux RND transporter permease subunit [Endozoicomonas arenosclerae]|uniref:efflux RND transporter permease subunit n=1 Tax=Endozoicomonas arenosclerae TaxID=1633495 RepID=UPI000783FFE8|nr:efflux RND transporter permease subunit [Endozoicomonas arenosclerae]